MSRGRVGDGLAAGLEVTGLAKGLRIYMYT